MTGIVYTRVLEYKSIICGEQNMLMKKIVKWAMLVPVKIVEWIMWPVAKVHAWLHQFAEWLRKTMK